MAQQKRIVSVIALVFACATWAAADGEKPRSFIVNGSFEQQMDGVLAGWGIYTVPAREDAAQYLAPSKDKAKDGDWALKLSFQEPPKDPKNPANTCMLLFNGEVDPAIIQGKGKTFVMSGWVYVQAGAAPSPVIFRVRTFGPGPQGPSDFLGDLFNITATGKPGEWVKFEETAVLDAKKDIKSLNLQCGWTNARQATTQYVDDLRLVVKDEATPAAK